MSLYAGGRGLLAQGVVGNIGMVAALDHDPDRPVYRRHLRQPGQAGDRRVRRDIGVEEKHGWPDVRWPGLAFALPNCPRLASDHP